MATESLSAPVEMQDETRAPAARAGGPFFHLVHRVLKRIEHGRLRLVFGGQTREYGDAGNDLEATLAVHDGRFFRDLVLHGEVGLGRSYVEKKWSSPDLEDLTLVLQLNVGAFVPMMKGGSFLLYCSRFVERFSQRGLSHSRRSTLESCRDKMGVSYGVGNDFFRVALGPSMQYSCAIWASPGDTLEQAQQHKLDILLHKLAAAEHHRVLDVGCGWGTLLKEIHARHGCSVKGIALEQKQIDHCRQTFPEGEFERTDYRQLDEAEAYDRIISVGMIEHVGYHYIQTFMDSVARLLKPGGRAVLHTIVVGDAMPVEPGLHFDTFVSSTIMPIGYIPTRRELVQAINRAGDLRPVHHELFGQHYGQTMRAWRRNVLAGAGEIAGSYSEEHVRVYDYIYGLNSGSFTAGALDLLQIVVEKGPLNNDIRVYDPRA